MISLSQSNEVTYKFVKETSGTSGICSEPPTKIKISLYDDVSLDVLLETFRDFLVASGFGLKDDEDVAIVREIQEERDSENDTDN